MAEAAIPSDVEENEQEVEQTERPKSARELAMEQLDQSRRSRLKEEGIDLDEDSDDAGEDDTSAAEVPDDPPAPKKVKLKVDGEEREVDEQAVIDAGIRALQKESAADKRLEEATRLLREAQVQVARQTAVEPPKVEKPADDDVEKEVIDALMTGDEDKARLALRKFREAARPVVQDEGRAAIPDPSRIAAEVKAQLSFESASEKFKGDFPEIVADPYLAGIADQYLDAALKSGTHKTWDSALTAAGKATQDWLAKFRGETPPTTPPTTQRTGLAEKKRGIDVIPSASSSASVAAEDEPESVGSVIAAMKKARGQTL
jgi:hypothetical protein